MMTLDEAIKHAEAVAKEKRLKAHDLKQCKDYGNPKSTITSGVVKCEACAEEHHQLAEWLKELKQLRKQTSWIPIVTRKPTHDEKDSYFAQNGEELCFMVESEMPLNGQKVIVSSGGYVAEDVFDEDFYNFESLDLESVDAWMQMPKPYKAEMRGGKCRKQKSIE